MRKSICGFGLFLISTGILAQNFNLGLPFIQSYPREIYQAAAQNWDITQDERGIMYFANAEGMLRFDGDDWNIYHLPNKSIVRSLELSDAGEIYVGGQNEYGIFSPNDRGDWDFVSLKQLIPEVHRNFEDVWNLVYTNEETYFRSVNKIFHFVGEHCTVFDQEDFVFLGKVEETVFVQSKEGNLYKFEGDRLSFVTNTHQSNKPELTGVIQLGGMHLFSSRQHGFFVLQGGEFKTWAAHLLDTLKQIEITRLVKISNQKFAIATAFGGLIILDQEAVIHQWIKREDGLIRNRVLSLCKDRNHNLWVGLENGINHIQINSPFSRIYPDEAFKGAGYDVHLYEGAIYFGTSNGLYTAPWKEYYPPNETKSFQLVENTKGQTWGLDTVAGKLILSHNRGAFRVKGEQGLSFFEEVGVWLTGSLSNYPKVFYAGTYGGLSFFEDREQGINFLFTLKDLQESSRFVEQDVQGNIWIAHPYRGIFRIEPVADLKESVLKKYGKKDGLPDDLNNRLFKIGSQIVFCGERGIYYFDYENNQFEPFERFNEIFGMETNIRRLKELPSGDIWYIGGEEVGVLRVEDVGVDKHIRKELFPKLASQLNKGFEQIYGVGENHVFITTEEGFIHYDNAYEAPIDTFFKAIIKEVQLTGLRDSTVFAGIKAKNQKAEQAVFSAGLNAFRFRFSATDFTESQYLEYRFKLKGFDTNWSFWGTQQSKEYTSLKPGAYTFMLQARTRAGKVSESEDYYFYIKAPWYANNIAYILYILFFVSFLVALYRFQNKKYAALQKDHEEVIVASKEEIGKLKEEQIQAELAYKQRELVTATMHLVQKNEILDTVRSALKEIRKKSQDEAMNKNLMDLIRMLQQDAILESGWEQFTAHFNELNKDFFDKLKKQFPDLTPKDLKLCAYLRMNLSTKEIASLLNVTVRGIEASRYRIRKKLALESSDNLTDFLMNY